MKRTRQYIQRRVIDPLLVFLKQGLSAEKLALTAAVGVALSLCPFVGTTTITCAIAAFVFRLNLGAIQVVNYAVFPLQLLLMVPFIQAGVWLFGADPLPFTAQELQYLARHEPLQIIRQLWNYLLMGVVVWAALLAPLTFGLYRIFLPVFRKLAVAQSPKA